MLSISGARSADGAVKYYMHMEKDSMGKPGEYYSKEGAGVWMGVGAGRLGFDGPVTKQDFAAMCSGFNKDGVGLVKNLRDPARRAGWDLTFSAPKSVSVAWSVATPEIRAQIEAAHARACAAAFKFMEDKGGFARNGEKADLVAAAFQHGTSRPVEGVIAPQLHTHYFVMNVAVSEDGRTSTIESANLFDYKMAGGAAYQVGMSSEIQQLGFPIERDGDASFRITTVPRSLEFEQSPRRAEIVALMELNGVSGGAASSVANLETRESKGDVDLPVLRDEWGVIAARHGYTADQARPDYRTPEKEKTYEISSYAGAELAGPADQLHQPGLTEAPGLESLSTFNQVHELSSLSLDGHQDRPEMLLQSSARDDLDTKGPNGADRLRWSGNVQAVAPSLQEALAPGRERERPPTTTDVLNKATEHDAIIRDTQIQLAALRASITVQGLDPARALAEKAKGEAVAVERLDGYVDRKGQTYSTDALMRAERAVMAIANARAGEDKTISLEIIQAAIIKTQEAKGHTLNDEQKAAVLAIAGTSGATKVLIGDAGTGKSTTMDAVRRAHEDAGYRVIGTSTGGKAAAELEKSSGIESRSLAKLTSDLSKGRDQLTDKTVIVLDEAGMTDSRAMAQVMRQAETAGTKVILVGDYKQLQPVGAGETLRHIVADVGAVRLADNQRQRAQWERDAVKQMSKGEAATALASYAARGAVDIQKDYKAAVAAVAERQIQNIDKVGASNTTAVAGTNAAVKAINEAIRAQLQARGELQNEKNMLTPKGSILLAEGDRILIRTTDKEARQFQNGDMATVKKMDDGKLTVVIDRTGNTADIDTKKIDLTHGYAITTHKAQGSTYDKATIYLTSQTSREMAYVQASRARDGTDFVMSLHHLKELKAASPSTPEMRAAVDKVIEARQVAGKEPGITPEAKENYAKAITYLEKNAAYAPESVKDYTVAEQLRDVARAMSISKPKESTLDYEAVQRRQENEPRKTQTEEPYMSTKQQEAEDAARDYVAAMNTAELPFTDPEGRPKEELQKLAEQAKTSLEHKLRQLNDKERFAVVQKVKGEPGGAKMARGLDRGAPAGAPILVEFGPAKYQHDEKNAMSYFVKTKDDNGREKTAWGVDLARAVDASGVKVGDRVTVTREQEQKAVTVNVNVRDAAGNVVGKEPADALRNTWSIKLAETPAPVKDAHAAANTKPELATPATMKDAVGKLEEWRTSVETVSLNIEDTARVAAAAAMQKLTPVERQVAFEQAGFIPEDKVLMETKIREIDTAHAREAALDFVAARQAADRQPAGPIKDTLEKQADQVRGRVVEQMAQLKPQERAEVAQAVKDTPGSNDLARGLERDVDRVMNQQHNDALVHKAAIALQEYKDAQLDKAKTFDAKEFDGRQDNIDDHQLAKEREAEAREAAGKEIARLEPAARQEAYKEAGLSHQERQPIEAEVNQHDRDREQTMNRDDDYYRDVTGDKNYDRDQPRDLDKETAAAEKAVKEYEQIRELVGPEVEDTKITLELAARAVDDLPSWRQAEVLETFPKGTQQEIGDAMKDLDMDKDKDKEHGPDGPDV